MAFPWVDYKVWNQKLSSLTQDFCTGA